jgi:hypothetical protein
MKKIWDYLDDFIHWPYAIFWMILLLLIGCGIAEKCGFVHHGY